jgi:hypothetical protein
MATQASPITDQAGVNSAPSFDTAAETMLDYNPQAPVDTAEETTAAVQETTDAAAATADTTKDAAAVAADGTKAVETAAAAVVDPWAIDAKLLEVALANPEIAPLVKTMQGQLAEAAKWREFFPTVAEAQQFKAMAPGGVEELKSTVEAAQSAKAENAEFASGDPARQGAVLAGLAKDMPEAFASSAKPYLETLKTTAPDKYNAIARELATEGLQSDGVVEALGALFTAAKANNGEGDEKAFGEAFGKLAEWFGKAGFAGAAPAKAKEQTQQLSPEIQRALDENKQYKANEARQTLETFNTWKKGLDDGFEKAAKADINTRIEEVVPKNIPTAVRQALVTRLENEIFTEVQKRINADTDLGQKIAAVLGTKEQLHWKTAGEKTREQVHNLVYARAKQLLPHVAPAILNVFAEQTVATNQQRVEREQQASTKTDVRGTGSTNTKPKGALDVKDVKGNGKLRNVSDEQILEM